MLTIIAMGVLFLQVVGNPIVPQPAPAPSNITVHVETPPPPPPDPIATQAMYDYVTTNDRYNQVEVPVGWAQGLLGHENIWTRTPTGYRDDGAFGQLRRGVRVLAMGLFLLAILWTGGQLLLGSMMSATGYEQLLPALLAGFLIAVFSDLIVRRSIDLNNWMCAVLGQPSLADFSASGLAMPPRPEPPQPGVGPLQLAAGFASGLFTSLLYSIALVIIEVKMIYRQAVLIVTDVAMPAAGALWAVKITRGYGSVLFRLFFGWLFGQPLLVLCLGLAGTLLGLMNVHDGPAEVLIKLTILLIAIKAISLFAGGGLGSGAIFGIASLLMLMRRSQHMFRGSSGQRSQPPSPAPAVVAGSAGGTGQGTAATGRPWRPALGTA